MKSPAPTSNKVLAVVYGLLAISFAMLLLQLLASGQSFKDPEGIVLSVVSGAASVITAISTWVKWHDNFPYRYDSPYPVSRFSLILKAVFGSFMLTVATLLIIIVAGLYLFGFAAVDKLFGYTSVIVMTLTAAFFPFVRRHVK